MRKITSLLMLLLCFVGVVKAENIVFNAQSETALPGTLASGQYTWTSPTITAPADFKTLRLTFCGNIGVGKDSYGFPHVAIAEFYLFDKDGNRVKLTTENFSSNATETNEGKSGLHALCNGFDVKQGSEGDYDWYWHSYWSAGAESLHYLEIDLDGVTADLSTFTFKYVTRQENGTPTEMLVTTGSSSENVASQAQSSQLLFANYDLANQAFRLKNSNITDADLYMTIETPNSNDQNEGGIKILEKSKENANSQAFKFEKIDGGFNIKSESGYYLNTLSSWGFNAVESASDNSKFEIIYIGEGEFKIKGTMGYVGPNDNYKTGHPYEMFSNHGLDKLYLDWTLEPYVVEYEVVYNYKLNGEVVKTETHIVRETEDYPDLKTAFGMTTSDAKPNGKVDANGTFDFNYTSTVPFTWETNVDAISNWYTIKMHSNNKKYIKYVANGNYLSWVDAQFGLGKDQYAWAFIGNPFDGFKLVNKYLGAEKALKSTNSGNPSMQNAADATVFVYAQSDVNGAGYFCLQYPGGNYLNAQNGKVAHWGDNDAGSTIEVAPFEYTLDECLSDLQEIYEVVDNAFGTEPGLYKEMEHSLEDALYMAWYLAGDAIVSDEEKDEYTISLLVDNLLAQWYGLLSNPDSREINLPVQGKFYRLKNVASGRYMNVKSASSVVVTDAGNNLPATIFYLGENNTMLSYSVGQYLDCGNKNLAAVGTSLSGEFAAARSGAKPNTIMYKNNSYWTFGNRDNDASIDRGSTKPGANEVGYDWKLEEVTWLPVPMNTTAGYATLYAPVALNNGGRVEAYVGKAEGEWFNMTRVDEDGVIPANTPVVLKYVDDDQVENNCVYLQVSDSEKSAVVGEENALQGTFADTYVTEDSYVLGMVGSEVGFYTATKNQQTNTSWLNNGFKAYLPKTVGSNVQALRFNFGGETTAIDAVEVENANAPIYDLSGRRVLSTVKGGIYIQNGKKFIVK